MSEINIHNSEIKVGIIYDLVIVGAGPAGLTLATLAINNNYKVLVIETENNIGGCHRVTRDSTGLFSEHGPRVYTDSSKTFMKILQYMNMDFYKYFTPYKFNQDILKIIYETLNSKELLALTLAFSNLIINDKYGYTDSLQEWLINKQFSKSSMQLLDRICKLMDGGGIDKYSLNKLLKTFDTQAFYKMFQPNSPNDLGLFKDWKEYLDNKGVSFLLGTKIVDISVSKLNKTIDYLIGQNKTDLIQIKSLDYIFACPPIQFKYLRDNITDSSVDTNLFLGPRFDTFALDTNYVKYITMTFHWKDKHVIKKYGFTNGKTYYDIVFVNLSDYMTNNTNDTSKTMISLNISNLTTKSPRNNKTALECTRDELVTEVFQQLSDYIGDIGDIEDVLKLYDSVTFSNDFDTAFIETYKNHEIPFKSPELSNLYTLGTHNNKSSMPITSIESAVENAVVFFNEKYAKKNKVKLGFRFTLVHLIILVIILVIFLVYRYFH